MNNELFFRNKDFSDEFEFAYATTPDKDGNRTVARPVKMAPDDLTLPDWKPTFVLNREACQHLVNSLYRAGFTAKNDHLKEENEFLKKVLLTTRGS